MVAGGVPGRGLGVALVAGQVADEGLSEAQVECGVDERVDHARGPPHPCTDDEYSRVYLKVPTNSQRW